MAVAIRQAVSGDLDALVPLFDGYRQFYRQPSDADGSRAFLRDRLDKEDSVILVAEQDGEMLGFTQLYPSLSSVSMRPILILNDLFVRPDARGTGAGGALLDAAVEYGRAAGVKSLTLTTEHSNAHAQAVYEAKNWVADAEFKTYHFRLDD